MKRIVACISLAMAMAVSVTSYAATTYHPDNSVVDSDMESYQTVLITKKIATDASVTSDDIVYVDQADGAGFTEITKFLLKATPTAGEYKITMGGTEVTTPKEAYFTIGNGDLLDKSTDVAMTASDETEDTVTNTEDATTVNKAFIYTGEASANYTAIKVFATDEQGNVSSVGYNFDTALPAIEGSLTLAVEIQGISEAHSDNIQVYLSSAAVNYVEGETTEQ